MRRLGRTGWVLLSLLLLTGAAWVAARWYLSSSGAAQQIARALRERLALPVQLKQASVGMMGGTTLGGLSVPEPGDEAAEPLLSVEKVEADLSILGALSGSLPTRLTLSGVRLNLRFDAAGKLLTPLPDAGGKSTLPRIELRDVQVTLRQTGRQPVVLHGKQAVVATGDGGVTLTGSLDDPYWGDWSVSGRRKDDGAVELTLKADDAAVTQEKLTRLPFVAPAVWQEVQAEGRTPVKLTVRLAGSEAEVRYRLDLQPRDTRVRVAAIDLSADQASGKLTVEGARVTLRDVQGRTAGGTVALNGDLDFTSPAARLRFDVRVGGLAVSELPASWQLPVRNGRLTGEANLTLSLRDGKLHTVGSGKGHIRDVELAGGTGNIELRLQGDGRRFRFQSAAPVSVEDYLQISADVPPVELLTVPTRLAARAVGGWSGGTVTLSRDAE